MAKIVDIGRKPDVPRRAVARGEIHLRPSTVAAIRAGDVEKGDPLAAAEVAGLQAMKSVWQVLPHCHPVPLTSASVEFEIRKDRVACTTTAEATYKTGVEMEALYACAVALLAVWDMVKPLKKDREGQYPAARIGALQVVSKDKGRARRSAR